MKEFILALASQWLEAEAAFAMSCLSSHWRAIMGGDRRDYGDLWKQILANSHPHLAESASNETNMNYRLFTLALWKGKTPGVIRIEDPRYTPTLPPENFFAVVELLRKPRSENGEELSNEVLGSWICPINAAEPETNELVVKKFGEKDALILKGPNPYSEEERDSNDARAWQRHGAGTSPFRYALAKIMGKSVGNGRNQNVGALVATCTLFRRDTMKSVRLFTVNLFDDWKMYSGSPSEDHRYFYGHPGGYYLNLAPSEAGMRARCMMYDMGESYLIVATGKVTLSPKVPSPGSEEEPTWLANDRLAFAEHRAYQPNDEDRANLAGISQFEFEVKELSFDLKGRADNETLDFVDEDEVMVALEGLWWE